MSRALGSWLGTAIGLALGAAAALVPQTALAYCQTTTCDPGADCNIDPDTCCVLDEHGCDTNGQVITWPTDCVSFSAHEAASPARGIDLTTFNSVLEDSFASWTSLTCDGSGLSIEALNFGPSSCGTPRFNQDGKNSNVWMFRDDVWPYEGSGAGEGASAVDAAALALTTISFNWRTAEIYDADVELNSANAEFTVGDERVVFDLQSIVTHEAGHFLGLDHSDDASATMYANYRPGSDTQRSLAPDDGAGLCESYPINRRIPEGGCAPTSGFTAECSGGGCSLAGGAGTSRCSSRPTAPAMPWMLLGLGTLLAAVVRRRQRQVS